MARWPRASWTQRRTLSGDLFLSALAFFGETARVLVERRTQSRRERHLGVLDVTCVLRESTRSENLEYSAAPEIVRLALWRQRYSSYTIACCICRLRA